ncbi:response regulator transcription factor [Clostridium sp. NSJ-6]|uniref:Stage 0 sporulation protein A homolog n=1 Tax=Clostridium hominis TaxID=2763036 RepID=A0ABR7DBD3_9CLOT|nr:response regulator transcription factor [Clostridium hominis]MBC5628699.1 response regulator transcription factor [Clostridium hominis]
MRLLLIEDEEDLINTLSRGLRKVGYAVDTATDGRDGLDLFYMNEYDLIILDLNLPSMDGLEILSKIREENQDCKILILSARSNYEQRIEGLDKGADDYLVKPFDFGELNARIRNLLRRSFTQQSTKLKYENIIIDMAKRTVYGENNENIDIRPKEFAILEYLIINRGRVISAEELIEHIWDNDESMFSNVIKVHLSNLRKKLNQHCKEEIILNVRGVGYTINEGESEK